MKNQKRLAHYRFLSTPSELDRDSTAESVYIAQDFHRFGNKGIPIIAHIGEIIGTDLAVQSAGVLDLDAVIVFIKLNRCIPSVIPVHNGIHQQLSSSPIWVLGNCFFPKYTYGNGAFL